MESQVFCWLCVNVYEMFAWLSGVSAFLFLKDQLEHYTQMLQIACICIEISIYLSFYLSFDLSICIFLHFKENRAVCPLVALLYVRRYVRSCCLFRMSLGLIFPLAFCLLLQNLVSSALSCLCVFLKLYLCPGWCVAISVLSLCYLCYLMLSLCYLCAISLISLQYFSQICGLYTD